MGADSQANWKPMKRKLIELNIIRAVTRIRINAKRKLTAPRKNERPTAEKPVEYNFPRKS